MTTKEEYQERRERWAEALESGKYVQTTQQLHSKDGFCCLGVACDLYMKENGGRWRKTPTHFDHDYTFKGIGDVLPEEVRQWLGLRTRDGSFATHPRDKFGTHLAGENDDGKSFAEIAAIIRAAPEGLFVDGDA